MSSHVEFVGVTKLFGQHLAVDDISFTVAPGSFFSLLGPSGCGKSTTLRILSGFEHPTSGSILIDGDEVSGVPPYRRPTNMVFQRWALFPHMNVFTNVAFGLQVDRINKAEIETRVLKMLNMVGLSDFIDRKPGQLSGGQMQRVALARALVKQPKVLLLDEPLGALDLKLRGQMQLELKRIQREIGTTFIYVTHDQGEAMTMSDAIAVMNNGRIEQIGGPQTIYDTPGTRFVADFIGNTNLVNVEIVGAGQMGGSHTVRMGEVSFDAIAASDPGGSKTGSVSLRPERISIGLDASDVSATTSATVRETVFHGSSVLYVLALDKAEAEIHAEIPHIGSRPIHPVGANVQISWATDAARLFPEQT